MTIAFEGNYCYANIDGSYYMINYTNIEGIDENSSPDDVKEYISNHNIAAITENEDEYQELAAFFAEDDFYNDKIYEVKSGGVTYYLTDSAYQNYKTLQQSAGREGIDPGSYLKTAANSSSNTSVSTDRNVVIENLRDKNISAIEKSLSEETGAKSIKRHISTDYNFDDDSSQGIDKKLDSSKLSSVSELNAKSSAKDFIKAVDEMMDIIDDIDEINIENLDDINDFDDAMQKIAVAEAAVGKMSNLSDKIKGSNKALAGAGVGALGGAALGAIGGAVVSAIANGITFGSAGIMLGISAGPIGWAALGIGILGAAIGAAIGSGINDNAELQKKINELNEKIPDIETKKEEVENRFKESFEETIDDKKDKMQGMIKGKFNFENIKDIGSALGEIEDIIKFCNESIKPYGDFANEWNIKFDNSDYAKLLSEFGNEDSAVTYGNKYIDAFSTHIESKIEPKGVAIDDTVSFEDAAEQIQTLIDNINGIEGVDGLNTEKLTALIETLQKANQKVVDEDAENLTPGGGSNGGGASIDDYAQNHQTADENKDGVDGAASGGQYDVNTGKYDEAKEANEKGARELMNEYLDSISTEGKSVEELEALYKEIGKEKEKYQEYAEELGISLKGFDNAQNLVKEAEQAVVDDYLANINPYSKTSESELDVLKGELNAKRDSYSSIDGIDLSGFDKLLEDIEGAKAEIRRTNEITGSNDNTGGNFDGFDTTGDNTPVREQIKNYLDTVSASIEGKSKAELQKLYREVFEAKGEAMKYQGFDDLSGFDVMLDIIEEAIENYNSNNYETYDPYIPEGTSKREEMRQYLDSIPSLTDLSRRELRNLRNDILNKRAEYSEYAGFDDFSGFDAALRNIDEMISMLDTASYNTSSYDDYNYSASANKDDTYIAAYNDTEAAPADGDEIEIVVEEE